MRGRAAGRRNRRDHGNTLIEMLIAVTLMSGVVVGTMATLRATIISGTAHRDHANAHGWLQSASDILYAAEKVACDDSKPDNGESIVRDQYNFIVDQVSQPQDWADWQITIVPPVQFWNSGNLDADPDNEFFFGPACETGLTLQLIELEVTTVDGKIIENVEIVK
jgi:hypothetical protein